jgi:ABC-2 type transport system ATP-binding protein
VDDAHDPNGGAVPVPAPGAGVTPEGTGVTSEGPPAVVCEDLVVRYGDTVAVDRLSFVGRAGQVVALLGPNGAGKTSTVEALEGYRKVDGGSVRVLGLDPRHDHASLVPDVGVMLQNGGVYPMLGPAQVLDLFSRYYDDPEDPGALLDLVGLTAVRRTPWRRLSGGEQQRLSLALALVGRPRVLFLDEPTAGVDPEGRITVRDIIADRRDNGICVILTTHELSEAERLADLVVIVDHGRLLAEGSPADLASGTADGSIRFTTEPGIDTGALAAAVGAGCALDEERSGSYRLVPPPGSAVPTVVATLAGWLAERSLTLGDLRTGRSLEEAYLAITGRRGAGDTPPDRPGGAVRPSARSGQPGRGDRSGRGRSGRGRSERRQARDTRR